MSTTLPSVPGPLDRARPDLRVRAVAVVIPARDEEDTVASAVVAARAAVDRAGVEACVTGTVVVVADRCTDRTAARARDAGAVVVDSDRGRVGVARDRGARAVLGTSPWALPDLWLASTDADSRVDPDWLTTQVALADAGADVVVGTVRLLAGADPELARRWSHAYERGGAHRALGGHGHVHGASLGVRADAYVAVGGFDPLASDEDVDLVRRLQAAGHATAWPTSPTVATSGRAYGRCPQGTGTAADLRRLATTGEDR